MGCEGVEDVISFFLFWTVEEKLFFWYICLLCSISACLTFLFLSSESQSCWKIPVNGQKKGQKQKKKERNVKCSLKRDPSSHSFYHAPGQSRHVSQVCSSA